MCKKINVYQILNFSILNFLSAYLLVRRLRSSVRRKFDEINSPSKEQVNDDSTQTKFDNDIESKIDIQLQDNEKDKIVDEERENRLSAVVN